MRLQLAKRCDALTKELEILRLVEKVARNIGEELGRGNFKHCNESEYGGKVSRELWNMLAEPLEALDKLRESK